MKKIIKIFVGLFIIMGICCCNGFTNTIQLKAPENLRYDKGMLKWSIVENATSYIVSVDLDEYQIETNYFDLTKLSINEGKYKAKVKAVGTDRYITSLYCNEIVFSFSKEENSEPSNDTVEIIDGASIASNFKKNVVRQNKKYYEKDNIVSFCDNKYYYYIFDMGTAENVPLTSTYDYRYWEGKGAVIETFHKQKTTTTSIKTTVEHTVNEMHEDYEEDKFNINGTANAKFNIKAVKMSTTVSGGYSHFTYDKDSKTDVWMDSFENCQSISESIEETKQITFDQTSPVGYYAYRYVGVIKVFTSVVVDIESLEKGAPEIYIDTYSSIIASGYSYDYDESSALFESNIDESKFYFDIACLNEVLLHKPTNYYQNTDLYGRDLGTKDDPYIIANVDDFVNKIKKSGSDTFYLLINDVNFKNKDGEDLSYLYDPIEEFKGHIDGNGYAIKNYYKASIVNVETYGFFKNNSGTIKNLAFYNCEFGKVTNSLSAEKLFVGVVCGKNKGVLSNILVDNCKLSEIYMGKIETDKTYRTYAGLVCGLNDSGAIIEKTGAINSKVNAWSRTGYEIADCYSAGIAGQSSASMIYCYSNNNIIKAYTKGSVKGLFNGTKGTLYSYAGGIVGRLYSGNSLGNSIVYNNEISSVAEEANNHYYSDLYCPELNGMKNECYNQNTIPSSFSTSLWKTSENGVVINFNWKY